jgi:hypothetical protein
MVDGDPDSMSRDTWFQTVGALKAEKEKLREAAAAPKVEPDLNWCEVALPTTSPDWETATVGERVGMLAEIFGHIEAVKTDGRITITATPRELVELLRAGREQPREYDANRVVNLA